MYVQYGNYAHAANEATVVIDRKTLENEAHVPYGIEETWGIRGLLQAPTPLLLNASIALMQAAYRVNYQSVGLFFDGGLPTTHAMPGLTPIGGVMVVQQPSFPEGGGGEFSTYRNYHITLRGRYNFPEFLKNVLTWRESLSLSGGGPRFVMLQPLSGPPIKQFTADATPYVAVQEGQATGLIKYPTPPSPLFPGDEHRDRRRITPITPERVGLPPQINYWQYGVSWHYEFESDGILQGVPDPGWDLI
jgi:hypothetical protein